MAWALNADEQVCHSFFPFRAVYRLIFQLSILFPLFYLLKFKGSRRFEIWAFFFFSFNNLTGNFVPLTCPERCLFFSFFSRF